MSNKRKYLVSTAILLSTLGSAYQASAEAADISNNSSGVVIVQNDNNEKLNQDLIIQPSDSLELAGGCSDSTCSHGSHASHSSHSSHSSHASHASSAV